MTEPHHQLSAESCDLKPCPFCGGKATIQKRMDEDLWTHNIVEWVGVHCDECGIYFEQPETSDTTAAGDWNKRAYEIEKERASITDDAQSVGVREALEMAERELTDLARPLCCVFNRSTKKYEFTDDHIAKGLPGTFEVIQQIRAAIAAQPPAAPVETCPVCKGDNRICVPARDCPRMTAPPRLSAGNASDFEQVFRDACDEVGCEYDNEALLSSIAALKHDLDRYIQIATDIANEPQTSGVWQPIETAPKDGSPIDRERTVDTATRFQCTEANIRQIQSGKTWRHDRMEYRQWTDQEIQRIRALPVGVKGLVKDLAKEFGVSINTIYRIKNAQSYRHVNPQQGNCK